MSVAACCCAVNGGSKVILTDKSRVWICSSYTFVVVFDSSCDIGGRSSRLNLLRFYESTWIVDVFEHNDERFVVSPCDGQLRSVSTQVLCHLKLLSLRFNVSMGAREGAGAGWNDFDTHGNVLASAAICLLSFNIILGSGGKSLERREDTSDEALVVLPVGKVTEGRVTSRH